MRGAFDSAANGAWMAWENAKAFSHSCQAGKGSKMQMAGRKTCGHLLPQQSGIFLRRSMGAETHNTGEHLPSGKLAAGFACGFGRFLRPANRV